MAEVSIYTISGFILTTLATVWFFFKAVKSKKILTGIILWMMVCGFLGLSGFYRVLDVVPPRFVFLIGPGILFVLLVFITKKGEKFIERMELKWLTLLHVIRVPVEIVLYYLFIGGLIPDLMTFEGYNFDILSGITAPLIYYTVFIKDWVGQKWLLFWNFICLALLLNILTIALLSAQTPLQKLAFDQPNVGVAFFPFVWLPAVIVPIVLFSHLASIKKLLTAGTAADDLR